MRGKGGAIHKRLQAELAEILFRQGLIVQVEGQIGGKFIDLVVCELGDLTRAWGIEIHLNRRWALLLDQIRRDLRSGATHVIVLVPTHNLVSCASFITPMLKPAEAERVRICSVFGYVQQEKSRINTTSNIEVQNRTIGTKRRRGYGTV